MRTIGKLSGLQMGKVVKLLTQYVSKNGKSPEIVSQVNAVISLLQQDISAIPTPAVTTEVK